MFLNYKMRFRGLKGKRLSTKRWILEGDEEFQKRKQTPFFLQKVRGRGSFKPIFKYPLRGHFAMAVTYLDIKAAKNVLNNE